MDVEKYWEKRRVQSLLRRLLEALQERYGLESDAQADLSPVFDALAAGCQGSSGSAAGAQGEAVEVAALDEGQLCSALEAVSGWPPDVTVYDKPEIFSAILVPSFAAARAVLSGQEPVRTAVTSRAFCEGLDRVPFNLPDFPVPVHNLPAALSQPALEAFTAEQTEAVAQAVATTFCMDRTGLDRVKDFFLCGLISLEEIQRALPKLVPHGLVEDAVTRIIRRGAPLFSPEEWDAFVVVLRTSEAASCAESVDGVGDSVAAISPQEVEAQPAPEAAPIPQQPTPQLLSPKRQPASSQPQPLATTQSPERSGGSCLVSLASPMDHHRRVSASSSTAGAGEHALRHDTGESGLAAASTATGALGESPSADAAEPPRFRGRFEPVTEPLPCRELRSEDPICFIHTADIAAAANAAAANAAPATSALPPAPPASPLVGSGQAPAPAGAPKRVVDWSTATNQSGARASSGTCPPGWHQADEGAGARLSWGTSGFKRELEMKAAALAAGGCDEEEPAPSQGGVDHLAWINLDLHHECAGPYLATAFVLCCQIYERRRLKANAC